MTELHDRIRDWWDEDADGYDASPGHAMSDPVERAAWRAVLGWALPATPAQVLDVGAGTGAMSLLAADLGFQVTALDLSEEMLGKAKDKAEGRGLAIEFAIGRAEEPPHGPFDVVIERHVLWTLPDPVAALRAWRSVVVPGGRLAIFEGSWGGEGPFARARAGMERVARRTLGDHRDAHHGPYPDDVLEQLPLRATRSPGSFIAAIEDAGWSRVRIARLRDVEWALAQREPWPLGWLGHRPRYALLADA